MTLKLVAADPAPATILPALRAPTMVDESNHRIANHLQMLCNMVSIEARRVVDPVARAVLDTTMGRLAAIANVHRHLHRHAASDRLDLGEYLEELGEQLAYSCGDTDGRRRVLVCAESVDVAPEVATSIGVIVSELVGNACKYAYRPDEPGDIKVSLGRFASAYVLEVTDRGRGITADAMPGGTGLGIRLITMMALRLGGTVNWSDAQPGTRFALYIPL